MAAAPRHAREHRALRIGLAAVLTAPLLATLAPTQALAASPDPVPPVVTKPGGVPVRTDSSADSRTLHWYDGQQRRAVRIQPGTTLESEGLTGAARGAALKETTPVFVDADTPGRMRALPGGVIVQLDRPLSARELEARLAGFDVRVERALGDGDTTWLLAGEPGVASIELANAIFESGLVRSAAPNWVKPRTRK